MRAIIAVRKGRFFFGKSLRVEVFVTMWVVPREGFCIFDDFLTFRRRDGKIKIFDFTPFEVPMVFNRTTTLSLVRE